MFDYKGKETKIGDKVRHTKTHVVGEVRDVYLHMIRVSVRSRDEDWHCLDCEVIEEAKVRAAPPAQAAEADPHGIDQHAPGAKLDAGKIMGGLLGDFSRALLAVAEVGTFGAEKYSRGGWQSVPNGIERYTDAAWRHLLKESLENLDPDSDLLHAAHLAWNALSRLELMLRESTDEPK